MVKILEKTERRLGEKLFLKGDRCSGPKCALVRRGYPPGAHGKKRKRKRGPSEYGKTLNEKQKVRFLYGLDDRNVRRYTKKAASMPGVFSSNFLRLLEGRLDNAVYRLGFAESRPKSRHLVSYQHVTVNGRIVTIPSYQLKKGDIIAIKDSSLGSQLLEGFEARIKKLETPAWLNLDKNTKKATVAGIPEVETIETQFDITKIKEFYSR